MLRPMERYSSEDLFKELEIYPLKVPNTYFASLLTDRFSKGVLAQNLSKEGTIK